MNNVKKALVAVGALMALAGQVQAQSFPETPPGAAAGYAQFGVEMHDFCHMPQPTGVFGYGWGCVYHDNRPSEEFFITNGSET